LAEDERGLAVSTLGKVIRRGWDWIGIAPANPEYVNGLIEIPELAEALTLNKGDFMRTGARGALFLGYRKAVQEAVSGLLAEWGALPSGKSERQPRVRPIERDLQKILAELADEFPLLATLADRRAGGQRPLPLSSGLGAAEEVYAAAEAEGSATGASRALADSEAEARPETEPQSAQSESASIEPVGITHESTPPDRTRRRGPAKLSLEIRFETRAEEDATLGRLIDATVWVNDAHPAYRRAVASRSEGYHIALTVALAVAPLAIENARIDDFVSAFLAYWGEAAISGAARSRVRKPKRA
jgi:hypothetical protein